MHLSGSIEVCKKNQLKVFARLKDIVPQLYFGHDLLLCSSFQENRLQIFLDANGSFVCGYQCLSCQYCSCVLCVSIPVAC